MWRWLRVALAGAAVVLLVVAVWTPEPKAGPPEVGRAVQTDGAGTGRPVVRSHDAPSLLVDRDNPRVVYLSGVDLATGACTFSVSIDGGATWRAENAPRLEPYTRNCALGSAHPQNVRTDLEQGPDGTLYYVLQGNDPAAGGTRSVLIGRSSDGGRMWSTAVVDAGPKATTPEEAELNFEGHAAVDPDRPDVVYVMWRRSFPVVDPAVPPPPSRPYFAVSHDRGRTFGAPTQLVDADLGSDGPRPLVVHGVVYAFYRQAPPPLPTGSPAPSPTPPLTRVFVAASTDGGKTWARSEIAAARDASDPVPVYDAKRKLFHVVWHDNRRDELDVWYSNSSDAVGWSQPRLLNDDPAGTRVGQHYPQIAISPSGRLDVAWYDWRDDPFPAPAVGPGNVLGTFSNRGKLASVYLTSSSDGGRTWSRNLRVNDQLIDRTVGTWANNYDVVAPPAIASTRKTAIVAWSDTREATALSQSQDVVAARVTFVPARGGRVTSLQAIVVGLLVGAAVAMWGAVLIMRRQAQRPSARWPAVNQPAGVP